MTDQDNQDKLAAEWAASLEQEKGSASADSSAQDDEALAAQWAAALENDQDAGAAKGSHDDALADEWASALAEDEHSRIKKEHGKKQMAAQGRDYEFKDLTADAKVNQGEKSKRDLDFILDIPLSVSAQLGSTQLLINELLQLGQGSVIELNKLAGEPLEILVNGKLVARGEAVVINEKFGVRLTDIISPIERVKQLV